MANAMGRLNVNGNVHGGSVHGGNVHGGSVHGSMHGNNMYQQQQQQLPQPLARQSSGGMFPPQQPAFPLQHQPSMSRHGSQQLLQSQLQDPSTRGGGSYMGAGAAYDGSMRGANLFATSLQQQQQPQQLQHQRSLQLGMGGKPRSCLDLSDAASAPSPKGHGIVLNLGGPAPSPSGGGKFAGGYAAAPSPTSQGPSMGAFDSMRSLNSFESGGMPPLPPGGRMSLPGGGPSMHGSGVYAPLVSHVQRPDGTYKEVDPERAVQLHRYRCAWDCSFVMQILAYMKCC
jgi:hypothetical protein